MKARPRAPTRKTEKAVDHRQNNGSVKAVSLAIAQQLEYFEVAVSTAVLGQSHKDNVRCAAVEEQLEA